MKVSVVIPTYNEEECIAECLEALIHNTRCPDKIIVSDGGSTDRTREIVKGFANVVLLDNPGKTAAAGRNVGIAYAAGDIVAFTDGDCIAAPDWIEKIENAFLKYPVDGIGGKVKTAYARNKYEEYWGNLAWNIIMSFGDEGYAVEKQTLNDAFVTANCAYKKQLLQELNGFDPWFANNAEDIDLCWRALRKGAGLRYVPDVIIEAHSVTSLKGIRQKSFRNGVSSSKLQKVYGGKVNFDPNIYKMLFRNIIGLFKCDEMAQLNAVELLWHLFGKYYGSFKAGVINF